MKHYDSSRIEQCPFRLEASDGWAYRCRLTPGHEGEHVLRVPKEMPTVLVVPGGE